MEAVLSSVKLASDIASHKVKQNDPLGWSELEKRLQKHHQMKRSVAAGWMSSDSIANLNKIAGISAERERYEAIARMIGLNDVVIHNEFHKIDAILDSHDSRIEHHAKAIDELKRRGDRSDKAIRAVNENTAEALNIGEGLRRDHNGLRSKVTATNKAHLESQKQIELKIELLEAYLYALPTHMREIVKTASTGADTEEHAAALQAAMLEDGVRPDKQEKVDGDSWTVAERVQDHDVKLSRLERINKEAGQRLAHNTKQTGKQIDAVTTRVDEQENALQAMQTRMAQLEMQQTTAARENDGLRAENESLRATVEKLRSGLIAGLSAA